MATPQELWDSVPPVTKAWAVCSFAATSAARLGYLDPFRLTFWFDAILHGENLALGNNICLFWEFQRSLVGRHVYSVEVWEPS